MELLALVYYWLRCSVVLRVVYLSGAAAHLGLASVDDSHRADLAEDDGQRTASFDYGVGCR